MVREEEKHHWIDNFHTAYNLDSLKRYIDHTGDEEFRPNLERGYRYFKEILRRSPDARVTITTELIPSTFSAPRRRSTPSVSLPTRIPTHYRWQRRSAGGPWKICGINLAIFTIVNIPH